MGDADGASPLIPPLYNIVVQKASLTTGNSLCTHDCNTLGHVNMVLGKTDKIMI